MLTMPAHTQRAHSTPSWKGDRLSALAVVGRRPLGPDHIHAADRNFQWAWRNPRNHAQGGIAYCLHWADPKRNNYRHITVAGGRRTRRMTRAELRRPIERWAAKDVRRWRRTSSVRSERPPTYAAMVRRAVAVGVTICAELKSAAFAIPAVAAQLVRTANRYGHPPFFMALFGSLPLCEQKCAAVIGAGGQFAVIFGRARLARKWRPVFNRTVHTWSVQPTRVW